MVKEDNFAFKEATISKLVLMGIVCFIIDLDIRFNFKAVNELDPVNTVLMVRLPIKLGNLTQLAVLLLVSRKLVIHKEAN